VISAKMRCLKWMMVFAVSLLFAACVPTATVIKEEVGSNERFVSPVLVDTRPNFQFTASHLPGSIRLESSDFIILKSAASQERIFDPDLQQTIERLAKRGISPLKRIILISEKADSLENKKWTWLLNQLGVLRIERVSLKSYVEKNKLVPQAEPDPQAPWTVDNGLEIVKKAGDCFASWSELCQ
jgi:thiosulfate/3-mercaptopyruvate sulfurtransferase